MTQRETPLAAPAEQGGEKKLSRIQQRNRTRIMEAALDVFAAHGFRGATLDQIAKAAGLSKPNLLYYFDGKEAIHVMLLNRLMETWLNPLEEMDPNGDPLEEVMDYIHGKLQMSREFPRESRLFANEILQGAPRMKPHLESSLKPLVDEKTALLRQWMDNGKLAAVDPRHLLYSIWATTQHYADFEVQIDVLKPDDEDPIEGADTYLDTLFRKLLTP
ncbi:TetR family transcriptional regulator C-terminal domain-containing protein [Thalassobius sp. Cn5-15]|uniref:TetR family transcriptional regulator C-terminal domain-containing protein n=1 Tax=Thalassobius sp. Cn5-15 TaxID=2917763 RepID=UPI001EF1B615|nr:TetR family transcriptional regulator C-terminal domain-containing protein [Thalassobius sp. Cn5-15]MCG7493787.1 TetR family transcriptional regulator C-terminal domain-containing protein [Thalassobius sp. Cn5-15]